MLTEKECHTCKLTKPVSEFYKGQAKGGLQSECKLCHKARNNKRNHNLGPQFLAEQQLRIKYGMTLTQYDTLLESQGGHCAICPSTEPRNKATRFCVDHDHACCPGQKTCGKCIRGLLCHPCNQALGLLRDDPQTLIAALHYLIGDLSGLLTKLESYLLDEREKPGLAPLTTQSLRKSGDSDMIRM